MKLTAFIEKNTVGGSADDTIDISVTFWYQEYGSATIKTQVVEVATVCDDDARYTMYKVVFAINYDEGGNIVAVNDVFAMRLNLETDTSECADILFNHAIFLYQTNVPAMEIP